jgi:hypothetical protein
MCLEMGPPLGRDDGMVFLSKRHIYCVKVNVMIDGQSAGLSRCETPIWGTGPDFDYCQNIAVLLIWGALSGETTGLSFTNSVGPRQRSHICRLGTIAAILVREF